MEEIKSKQLFTSQLQLDKCISYNFYDKYISWFIVNFPTTALLRITQYRISNNLVVVYYDDNFNTILRANGKHYSNQAEAYYDVLNLFDAKIAIEKYLLVNRITISAK